MFGDVWRGFEGCLEGFLMFWMDGFWMFLDGLDVSVEVVTNQQMLYLSFGFSGCRTKHTAKGPSGSKGTPGRSVNVYQHPSQSPLRPALAPCLGL